MIGIYGGAYDPVHIAHLRVAIEAKEALNLEQVRMIPTGQPNHREAARATSADRLRMLELATAPLPFLVVDDREIRRQGLSYTVDTLQELSEELTAPLCLILGADAFAHFDQWQNWRRLFEYAHILVVPRPEFDEAEVVHHPKVTEFYAGDDPETRDVGTWSKLSVTPLAISSSAIRQRVRANQTVRYLAPSAVCDYLNAHELYR